MPREQEYDDLPQVVVTMNQVVAHNVTYFRKIRGLTQERLGERLTAITGKPWSKATVSALERGWDGNRIRQVDADELLALSQAVGFPVPALLLPPTEDGVSARYRFAWVGPSGYVREQQDGSAEDLINALFTSEPATSYPEDDAYVERLQAAFAYISGGEPEWSIWNNRDIEEWNRTAHDKSFGSDEHMIYLRTQIRVLRDLLGGLEKVAENLRSRDGEQPPEE